MAGAVIGHWTKQFSKSQQKWYWFTSHPKQQSLWHDDALPTGWAWGRESESAPRFFVNLYTGERVATAPTLPAKPVSPPMAPAAGAGQPSTAATSSATQLSFHASQTAGDDLGSTAYIPDPRVHGTNVPEKVRSKRDYLLGYGIPEDQRWKLQVDEVALYSITEGRQAEKMTSLIVESEAAYRRASTVPGQAHGAGTAADAQFTITDATAAVGGNVISFARHSSIGYVHGIELSRQRADMCKNNVAVASVAHKVTVHQGDAVATVAGASWPTHVVFMDPPWGGPEYASAASLDMFLGRVDVADWTVQLTGGDSSLTGPQGQKTVKAHIVAIKAPLNYNVEGLRRKLAAAGTGAVLVDVVPMHKMQLILVHSAPGAVLYTPGAEQVSRKRPREEHDGEAEDGGGHDHRRARPGGPQGNMTQSQHGDGGQANSTGAGAAGSGQPSGAAAASTHGASTSAGSGVSGHIGVCLELLAPTSAAAPGTAQGPLVPTGLFLQIAPNGRQFALRQETKVLHLIPAGVESSSSTSALHPFRLLRSDGAAEHSSGTAAPLFLAELQQGNYVLSSPGLDVSSFDGVAGASQHLCLGPGVTAGHGAAVVLGSLHASACTWRLHATFDLEVAMLATGSEVGAGAASVGTGAGAGGAGMPGSPLAAMCRCLGLPVLPASGGVAGEGKRGRVRRGHLSSTTAANAATWPQDQPAAPSSPPAPRPVVVKVQPWDVRVEEEVKSLAILTAAIHKTHSVTGPGSSGSDVLPVVSPFLVARDHGPWLALPQGASGQTIARCIQIMDDAGTAVEDVMKAAGKATGTGLGVLSWDVAMAVLRRVLQGLQALHSAGFLHADIHAGNVLLGVEDGAVTVSPAAVSTARLIDLGSIRPLAGVSASGHGGAYIGPSRGGRWDIMAPEQFGAGRYGQEGNVTLTPATDVYAAAATTVHLLLGRPPFQPAPQYEGGPPGKMTIDSCKNAPLRDPRALEAALKAACPVVPALELAALLKMLAPRPQDRYATAQEAMQALG